MANQIYFIFITLLFSISASAEGQGEKAISIEEFLQSLSTVPGVTDRRDPFQAAKPPFELAKSDADLALNASPLERYQVERYTVLATLTQDNRVPRALIKLPESEKRSVVMVKLFDRLGNRRGTITSIGMRGITVLQNQRSALGFVDKTEIFLPVGGVKEVEGAAK